MNIPGGLSIIVGMHIDKPRGDNFAPRVDDPISGASYSGRYQCDDAIFNSDIAVLDSAAGAVVYLPVFNENVVVSHL